MPVIFLHSSAGLMGAVYVFLYAIFTDSGTRTLLRIILYASLIVIYSLCQVAVL